MELIIVKNDHVFARAHDFESTETDVYSMNLVADNDIPEYPIEDAGKGWYWALDYEYGELVWCRKERPLTQEERLADLEDAVLRIAEVEEVEGEEQ